MDSQNEKLKEALEDMCFQFAGWSDTKGGLSTNGLSTLECAFSVLGWDDPRIVKELWCDEQGCKRRATCGTPTPAGYRKTCGQHIPKFI
jgi:hypothetical protein